MTTYTKIGRIRPDYADVWDSARSYTALEVVKSADSYQAYIAKQDVPAGTPLTDADYWGVVLDVSDVITESVAATNRANTAAEQADSAREGIQDDIAEINARTDQLYEEIFEQTPYIMTNDNGTAEQVLVGHSISSTGDLMNTDTYANFTTYIFKANANVSISLDEGYTNNMYTAIMIYSSAEIDASHAISDRYVKGSGGDTIAAAMPFNVKNGERIAITLRHDKADKVTIYGNVVNQFNGNTPLSQQHINQVIRPRYVRYEQVTSTEASSEQISVYLPLVDRYIKYKVIHSVSSERNADNWHMGILALCSADLTELYNLTTEAEMECAVQLQGRPDFSGGQIHGDEIGGAITVLLDGKPVDYSTLTDLTTFNTLCVVTDAILYDPNDSATPIAKHGAEREFTDILRIKQSVEWLVAETTTNCFLAMLAPKKTAGNQVVTNRFYTNNGFTVAEIPASLDAAIQINNANSATVFADVGDIMFRMSVPVYPTGLTNGDCFRLHDNGGNNYNKMYFRVCNGHTTSVGELWQSVTEYDVITK